MKIDLCELVNNPGMTSRVDIEDTCPEDESYVCTSPAKGYVSFSNTGELLLIAGAFKTEVKLACGRCLTDVTIPIDVEIEDEYKLERVGDSMQALPMDDEIDFGSELLHNNILDVHELLRQELLAALPIQPLCKPECEGLCPTCGENLNMRECQCPPAEIDSPFLALAELLEDKEDDK